MPLGTALCRLTRQKQLQNTEKAARRRPFVRQSRQRGYFTPCISFWISGATRNNSTPKMISDQNPNV